MLGSVENEPPIEFGSPFRSNRTRTFAIGAFELPTNSARICVWLLVAAVLVETTLGFADTEALLIGPIAGATAVDWTCTVCVFVTPPAVPTTSRLPVVAGAV